MGKETKDYGIEFVNVEIKYPLETLVEDGELPGESELFMWIGEKARNFIKIGFGYAESSHSFTASATDRGSIKQGEKPLTLTQHGKSPLSALHKLYFLLELCGDGTCQVGPMERRLMEREDYVSQQLVGLLKKKS